MSKHISRKQRWSQENSSRHVSALGSVVYKDRGWYGLLDFKTREQDDGQMPIWIARSQQLGPFKRPRNAMVALEREVTALQNRLGDGVLIGDEIWAEK